MKTYEVLNVDKMKGMFWVLILLLPFADGSFLQRRHKKNATFNENVLDQRTAIQFVGKRYVVAHEEITEVREYLEEECCQENCDEEELSDIYEHYGKHWAYVPMKLSGRTFAPKEDVYKLACEMSVREGKSCSCPRCGRSKIGEWYCKNPCRNDKFYCGGTKREACIDTSLKCNSIDDCSGKGEAWKDERSCTISSGLSTKLQYQNQDTKGFGRIKIDGKSICDSGWDSKDAEVACRQLGYDGSTIAQTLNLPHDNSAYIISNVGCRGTESSISRCSHTTIPSNCNYGAGIVCIDPTKLEFIPNNNEKDMLDGKETKDYKGRVVISDMPVIAKTTWDKNAAKVFCKTKVGKTFNSDHGIPVFAMGFGGSTPLPSRYSKYCITSVVCTGAEKDLSECSFGTGSNCNQADTATIVCAICSPAKINRIVDDIVLSGNQDAVKASITNARTELLRQCRNWDCSKTQDDPYTEYCQTKAFLEDLLILFQDLRKGPISAFYLTNDFNPIKKLESVYLSRSFNDLKTQIFEQGSILTDRFGYFYESLAKHDKDIATADCEYAWGVWDNAQTQVAIEQKSMSDQLTTLFKYAYGVTGGDLATKLTKLAISTTAFFNPAATLFDHAGSVLNVMNSVDDVLTQSVKISALRFLNDQALPDLKIVGTRIQGFVNNNIQVFSDLRVMFRLSDENKEFSIEKCKAFLDSYRAYSPAIKAADKAEYMHTLTSIVDGVCNYVENPDTAIGAVPALIASAKGACPIARKTLAVLEAHFDQMAQQQFDIMDCFAKISRARVAEELSKKIRTAFSGSDTTKLTVAMNKLDVLLTFRFNKKNLIQNACDFITYYKHGERPPSCGRLLDNPEGDPSTLFSFIAIGHKDMCHGTVESDYTFHIPATYSTHESGKVNLADLYTTRNGKTNGSVIFEMPDKNWMARNKWITQYEADNYGPFFLQQLDIFVPPSSKHTSFIQVRATLLKNTLNGKAYDFKHPLNIETQYEEHNANCNANKRDNLYNVQDCTPKHDSACIKIQGSVNRDLYPSMEKSLWRIELHSDTVLEQPFPDGNMYLAVRAKFCYKVPAVSSAPPSRSQRSLSTCCFNENKAYNPLTKQCESCPSGSAPKLLGWYCQKCPAGYQPGTGSGPKFGCDPCPLNEYKATAGNQNCVACPGGKTTAIIGSMNCNPPSSS